MSPSFRAGARVGFRACLPVSVGLVPWALVTGLAMVGAGFSTAQAMGMSLIVFGATAQLGTLPLIVAGAPLWLIVATALALPEDQARGEGSGWIMHETTKAGNDGSIMAAERARRC